MSVNHHQFIFNPNKDIVLFWCGTLLHQLNSKQQQDISMLKNCFKNFERGFNSFGNSLRNNFGLEVGAFCMIFICLFHLVALHGWLCSSRPGHVLSDQTDPWQLCLLCWISCDPVPPKLVPRRFACLKWTSVDTLVFGKYVYPLNLSPVMGISVGLFFVLYSNFIINCTSV